MRYYNIANNVFQEEGAITSYFLFKLKSLKVKFITNQSQINVNKLIVLDIANSLNLLVPRYIITNNKKDVNAFIDNYGKVITKDINSSFTYYHSTEQMLLYSEVVDKDTLDCVPEFFPMSLVQQYIDKDFEIRCFYFKGEFFSMAIFSQIDKKTEIDFRKYNLKKPNRTVPYVLPYEIQDKLSRLMSKIGLETGSFDLIKTIDDKFYFLEVNPIGQFGMVSYPCNYRLEELIAKSLLT